jgi:hypothetical protein
VYRVVVDVAVTEQVAALPASALLSDLDALDVLELVPGNGRPYNSEKPDGPMRELFFGDHNDGSITYLILADQHEVHVVLVQWFG